MIYDMGMQQISNKLSKRWLEIRGSVNVDGKGERKRIAIFDRSSMSTKAMRYSDGNGYWFWRIGEKVYPIHERKNRFLVLALDDTKTFNAEVYDYISPVLVEITLDLED